MTYNVPAHGEPNWDGKLNPSLQYLKDTAEAAETPAGAQAKATAAQNAAISAAATDATNKANTAQANAISSAATDATTKANSVQSNLNTHVGNVANPHSVTKSQVGLGNVPNVDATARANHTGTQLASTISDFDSASAGYVNDSASATRAALSKVQGRVYTPEAYGAKGDYDPATLAGTDDTTAIQNALNAAVATGGTVRFSDKHYKITSGLTVSSATALEIVGPRAGLMSGLGLARGAWIHGNFAGALLTIHDSSHVTVQGLGFHGFSTADGILLTSDNSPIITNHTYRNLAFYRVGTGVYVNSGGAGTQSDQMLFDSIRMDEIVTHCFRANSDNADGLKFLRCSTNMANSNTDTIHYRFDRGQMQSLDSCFGGGGQDFVRITSAIAGSVTIDNSQSEGSTHVSPAFLRIQGNLIDTTTLRGCTPDGPVRIEGNSRKVVSIGNFWNPAASITVAGSDARYTSIAENLAPITVSVTGTNARFTQLDGTVSGAPTTGTHYLGEFLWEILPDSAGALGYVCRQAGSPGRWQPIGRTAFGGFAPSLVTGTGSTAMSVVGNGYAGVVTFTTAAGLAVDASPVGVAFDSRDAALGVGNVPVVTLTPYNAAAAAALGFISFQASSQFNISLHNPPAGATVMKFGYHVDI